MKNNFRCMLLYGYRVAHGRIDARFYAAIMRVIQQMCVININNFAVIVN